MKFLQTTIIALLFTFCVNTAYAQTSITLDSTILEVETLIAGLDIPWEIKYNPLDGKLWTTERYGVVSRIDINTGVKEELLDLSSQVYEQSEAGLLGLTLHPDFATMPYVFFVYTYVSGSIKERLVRYSWDGSNLHSPLTIIEDIVGYTTHIGSRLLFLPDGTLLMTTGDAQDQPSALDLNELTGKVLRFNIDGSIPTDNPIAGSPVWSYGHRNAQGLVMAPNGIIYSSEHGPTTDDEFNILEMNGNYGWPEVHGFCDNPSENIYCANNTVTEPLYAWTPTIAPSDIIWYDHAAIPEFQNSILMAVLKNKRIIRLRFNAAGDVVQDETSYFVNEFGRIRDVAQGPDGELYLATNGSSWSNTSPFTHTILKLTPRNLRIAPKVFLEGPFDATSSLMDNTLATSGYLPSTEPYTALPEFNHSNGGETVDANVFESADQDAIVDWVMVELRLGSDNTQAVATRAALLQRDGDIVDLDGISPVSFRNWAADEYWVVIRHRNHIPIMSVSSLMLSFDVTTVDFTTGNAFGTDAQKSLGSGSFGMFAGDINSTQTVDAGDRSDAWNGRNTIGYLLVDSDLDGDCDAGDRSNCWNNRNKASQIP